MTFTRLESRPHPRVVRPPVAGYHVRPMNENDAAIYRHTLSALVTNEPGVLAQVAGMFAARGFNIDSLVVGRTENPELSRMTIVVNGNDAVLEQVRKQLQKLVPVVKVVDYKNTPVVERDLMLITVNAPAAGADARSKRSEILELVGIFRGHVVDVASDQVMIELAGTEEKVEAFVEVLRPYGIVELARTGVIAMARGNAASRARVRHAVTSAGDDDAGVDMADLPPG